jgi:2-polyprenyl-6-methoxyphenol hydroxylase-like FAD-dependent oxidoreductase
MLAEKTVAGSRVGIVGGSIGGCAAAIALGRLGCEVDVFERSSGALHDRGSGIAIPIPLRDELIDHGYLPSDYPNLPQVGRRWVAADGTDTGATLWQMAGPMVTNNWGVLWRSLRGQVDDRTYHDGCEVRSIDQSGDGVTISFADGTSRTFDVVLGADGYRSALRPLVAAEPDPVFAGYVLWRGNFPEAELTNRAEWDRVADERVWISVGFDGGHGVVYPIPDFDSDGSPGSRRVNWAIYAPTPDGLEVSGTTSLPPGSISEPVFHQLRELIEREFPPSIRPLFASPRLEVSIQPIYDLTIDRYVNDRIVLLGDAGTLSRPHTGSGATKAMQDARLLETLGGEHLTWGPLLAAYDTDRTATGNSLVEVGRRIGRDQVEQTPPWLEMSAEDFERWTKGTLSGQQLYLYGDEQASART